MVARLAVRGGLETREGSWRGVPSGFGVDKGARLKGPLGRGGGLDYSLDAGSCATLGCSCFAGCWSAAGCRRCGRKRRVVPVLLLVITRWERRQSTNPPQLQR